MFSFLILAALGVLLGSSGSTFRPFSAELIQSSSSTQTTNQQKAAPSQQSQASKPCSSPADSVSAKAADCATAPSTKSKKHNSTHADSAANAGSTKTVVRNGSIAEPTVAISPRESNQQASQQLNTTNQLLASTEANLKQIATRQLDADQDATVKQIKSYMEQARVAAKNGEMQRAYTLANKANLLSADLLGPRT
jgi:hypothetical protein